MKICFCISGQARGDMEALRELSREINKFPQNIDVTFVFSLWGRSGVKVDGALGYEQMHRIFAPDLAKVIPVSYYGIDFWRHFPLTFERLSSKSTLVVKKEVMALFPNAVVDIEDEVMDLEFSKPTGDRNSIKMLYKRWRCNEIKKKLEREDEKFDLVVVARPDVRLLVNPAAIDCEEDVIYVPYAGAKDGHTNDIMAYGSSSVIDRYCLLFSKAISQEHWSNVHKELYAHLDALGVKQVSPPGYVVPKKLEKNILIEPEELFADNLFIKSVYENEFDESLLDWSELISVNMKKYLACKEGVDGSALEYLILSDFSHREVLDDKYNRNIYLYEELLDLLLRFDYKSVDDVCGGKFGHCVNNMARINLEMFFESQYYMLHANVAWIVALIEGKSMSRLLEIESCVGMPSHLAVKLRNLAVDIENEDLRAASHLMRLAKDIRPGGPFIIRKCNEYEALLRGES